MPSRTTNFRAIDGDPIDSAKYNETMKDMEAVNKAFHGNRIIGASSFEVTDGGGLFIDVAAGEAVIGRHIKRDDASTGIAFPPSVTRWVWLKQETTYDVALGVITDTAINLEYTATSTPPAGETALLAKVTSDTDSITEIIDLRAFGNIWVDEDTFNMAGGLVVFDTADKTVKIREVREIVEKTADYPLTAADHNKMFTNGGASAQVILTLPSSPVDGFIVHVAVAAAFNLRILTQNGNEIHCGHLRTTGTGYIESSQEAASITLEYDASATHWVARSITRQWTGTTGVSAQLMRIGESVSDVHNEVWRQASLLSVTLPGNREDIQANSYAALSTGVLYLVGITLLDGMVITNVHFFSAGTGAGTPTNYWFALYDYARALLRQTADQTTTAWASSTEKALALSSPYTVPVGAGGRFYLGIMVAAATVPTLQGTDGRAVINDDVPIRAGRTTDTALTTTAPANAAAIANTQNIVAYAGVS